MLIPFRCFDDLIGGSKGSYAEKGWPRRIKIDKKIYQVNSEWEIRQIFDRFLREQESKLQTEESKPLTDPRAQNVRLIKSRITRAQNRLAEVVKNITQQEEELLLLLVDQGQAEAERTLMNTVDLLLLLEAENVRS